VHFSDWPFNIREFIHKSKGSATILAAAVRACGAKFVPKTLDIDSKVSKVILWAMATILLCLATFVFTMQAVRQYRLDSTPSIPTLWDGTKFDFLNEFAFHEGRVNPKVE